MAGNYDNTNTGALFENDKSQSKNPDKAPDQNGTCDLQCPSCGFTWQSWISGWFKTSKKGQPLLSLAFNPKDQNGGGQRRGGGNGGGFRGQGGGQGGGGYRGGQQGGGGQRGFQGGGFQQNGGGQQQGNFRGSQQGPDQGWQGNQKPGPNARGNWRDQQRGDIDDEIPF